MKDLFTSLKEPEIQIQFWGAFFAAAFSIFIVLGTSFVTSLGSRKKKHHDFLVKLESKLNHHLANSFAIIYIIEGVISSCRKNKISYNNIDSIKLEPIGDCHDLLDTHLINAIFSYDKNIEGLNADLSNIGNFYSEIRSAVFKGEIPVVQAESVYPKISNDLEILVKAWKNHIEESTKLMAEIRLCIPRDKGKLISAKHFLLGVGMKQFSKVEIEDEVKKLNGEVEETRKASRKKITEIYGK